MTVHISTTFVCPACQPRPISLKTYKYQGMRDFRTQAHQWKALISSIDKEDRAIGMYWGTCSVYSQLLEQRGPEDEVKTRV